MGERLFSENVRLERSKADINEGIKETFLHEPDEFFLGHNGISIICTGLHDTESKLTLFNPSIINGSQTLHVLQAAEEERPEARVLLRIIRIPAGRAGRQGLVSDIIERSNSQNAVASWELRANDPIQVELEHEFAKQRLFYERKASLWKRRRTTLQQRFEHSISMVRMGQILAASSGKADLAGKAATIFSGDSYKNLFDDTRTNFAETFAKYAVFRVVDRAFRDTIGRGDGYNPRDALWYFFACIWKNLNRNSNFTRRSKDVKLMRAFLLAQTGELATVYKRCGSLFISIRSSFVKRAKGATWNNAFKRSSLADKIMRGLPESKVLAVRQAIIDVLGRLEGGKQA